MKRKLRLHLTGILTLAFCVSCGQSVKETVKPVVPGTGSGQFMRVVIVPFADHTPASSLRDHYRRNVLVLEALQGALYGAGFISAAEEDVRGFLMDRGIIQASDSESGSYRTAQLEQELLEDWSEEMKSEIEDVINEDMTSRSGGKHAQKTIALSSQILKDLGNAFGADYVVRGRIIEYRSDQKDSFNPMRTGVLPFVFKSGQRTIFGLAEAENYESIDEELLENYNLMRGFLWGAGGFVTGLIGEKGGRVPGAVVQLRLMVQDARTGEVVWLNRAETSVCPDTAFADPDELELFATAVETTVNSLVSDFADALASGRVAKTGKKSPVAEHATEKPAFVSDVASGKAEMAAKEAASQAQKAAGEAKVAARESEKAEMFAKQAEDSAVEAKDAVKKASEATKKSEKIFEKIIAK